MPKTAKKAAPKPKAKAAAKTAAKTKAKNREPKVVVRKTDVKSVTVDQPNWITEENLKDYVQDVINSVVKTFHKHGHVVTDKPVLVYQQDKENLYPIALTDPAPGGERVIKLATYGPYRGQIAYQFAHEYCHTFTQHWINTLSHKSMWFAEMLCELASLWCICQMAKDWTAGDAPRAEWVEFGPKLQDYVDRHVKGVHVFGSVDEFAAWLKPTMWSLRKHSALRDLNTTVALHLLPLFQREPGIWEATVFLNVGQKEETDFDAHLRQWHDSTPKKLKKYVAMVAAEMGIKLN